MTNLILQKTKIRWVLAVTLWLFAALLNSCGGKDGGSPSTDSPYPYTPAPITTQPGTYPGVYPGTLTPVIQNTTPYLYNGICYVGNQTVDSSQCTSSSPQFPSNPYLSYSNYNPTQCYGTYVDPYFGYPVYCSGANCAGKKLINIAGTGIIQLCK